MKSAVILAGGKSRRMGIDKCTVLFHGKPLIYWPYSVLNNLVDEVIISVSKDRDTYALKHFFNKKVDIVRDEKPDLGPISGMLSSFKSSKGDYVACAPCDTPLLKKELYLKLFELAKESDGAVPVINNYWEPLHGVYNRKNMIDALNTVLNEGRMRPIDAYDYLNIKKLNQDTILSFDSDLASFININSFKDLANASSIFIKSRKAKNP